MKHSSIGPAAKWFSETYHDARNLFLTICNKTHARVDSFQYEDDAGPVAGLFVDIASIGAPTPEAVLVIISGTHGVEGFCGSGCQSAWLDTLATEVAKHQGLGVFLVHALNPHGFAECRRVTHENVDLNRNFVDFSNDGLPKNPEYSQLESLLNPNGLDANTLGRLNPDLVGWFASPAKIATFKTAVGRGQYDFPKGIIYGGRAPTWCNTLARRFISTLPQGIRVGAVVDIHTGLGEQGGLEIFTEDSAAKFQRISKWMPGKKVTTLGNPASLGYEITGALFQAFTKKDDSTNPWHCLALEFGTAPITQVLVALQADNWLNCFATDRKLAEQTRALMKDAFYVSSPDWQTAVISQTTDVIQETIDGMEAFR